MHCQRCRARLPEFLEGELRPSEAAAVERHVETCAGCRAELRRWRQLRTAVAEAALPGPGPEAPDWDVFEARVLARARAAGAPRPRGFVPWLLPAGAAAALAAIVFALGARGPATPPEGTALAGIAAVPVSGDDADALAAGLDLAWGTPVPWDIDPWLDDVDPTQWDALPVLLAVAFELDEWPEEYTADGEPAATDEWLTELETMDADALGAFLDALEGSAPS